MTRSGLAELAQNTSTATYYRADTIAPIAAELLRLRALHAALVEWRAKLAAYDKAVAAATDGFEQDPAADISEHALANMSATGSAESVARAALDAALKECEQ